MPDNQSAHTAGHGNVIVQNTGDGVSIVVGRPHLTLTRRLGFRTGSPELDLLAPYGRRVALCGRDAELAALRAFADSARPPESPVAVRVLIGEGGSGKTRLALECCDRLSSAGWDTGLLTNDELTRFYAGQNLAQWGWRRPTFIVVDYAASHAQALKGWLAELAARAPGSAPPLRLLLLERHADAQAGWWQTVFADGGWGSHAVRALCDPPEPVRLAPIAADERLRIVQALLAETGEALKLPLDAPRLRQQFDELTLGGQPLFLLMAALLMAERGTAALTLSRSDLAFALAGRERGRLNALAVARGLAPDFVTHLAACATLAQGASRAALRRFAADETAALGYTDAPAKLTDLLAEALPGPDGGVAPILPDLIGEAFAIDALREGEDAVVRCHAAFGHAVGVSLIRVAQDFAAVRPWVLDWLTVVADGVTTFAALAELANALPHSSVALAEFSVRLSERVLHAVRDAEDETGSAERAASLDNVSNRLGALGRREAALAACEEAVAVFRRLAAARPDVFERDLAMSLSNVSIRFGELGCYKAALAASEEAVAIYRRLATARPDAFEPDLAGSLNNVSVCFGKLGRHKDALAACEEAVVIRRRLTAARSDAFEPDLAGSLGNLANRLAGFGRNEAALAAIREAVTRYIPHFLSFPDACGQWMGILLQGYLDRCQDAYINPDMNLLAPLLPYFTKGSPDA